MFPIYHQKDVSLILINPFGAETGIFSEKLVNTLAADALAPCVASTSTAMVLNVWDTFIIVCLSTFYAISLVENYTKCIYSFYVS